MDKVDLIKSLKANRFSEKIIDAFEKIDRKAFIPKETRAEAYEDIPLPIGHGQTISQPYTIAFMLTHLDIKDNQKILEIGSGSGYVLALLSVLNPNGKIFGIERIKKLADKSKKLLRYKKNISIINADGSKGLDNEAPFDRILVSASADKIPNEIISQLKVNGILVIPVKNSIFKLTKNHENKIEEFPGFVFVPLVED